MWFYHVSDNHVSVSLSLNLTWNLSSSDLGEYRSLNFLPVQWTVFKQSNREESGLLFFLLLAKNNNDLYCYAVLSKFPHLCSTCKRASYPIDKYHLHNFKITKPPGTHMQNPDGFWEAWGAENHVTRVTYRPGGRSYHLFTFLRKKNGCGYYGLETDCNAIEFLQKNGDWRNFVTLRSLKPL